MKPGARRWRQQRPQHAQRRLVQVFRQVGDRSRDLPMHRVDAVVGRAAQGDDADVEPGPLEAEDLLGDEGFGQPRVALEHERRWARSRVSPAPGHQRQPRPFPLRDIGVHQVADPVEAVERAAVGGFARASSARGRRRRASREPARVLGLLGKQHVDEPEFGGPPGPDQLLLREARRAG